MVEPNLGDIARANYRDAFAEALATGEKHPLVIPFSIFGPLIVPALWLSIPHTKRPWLYQTRWLVLGYVFWFNIGLVRSTSSGNVACAYAAGLMAMWGIISTMHLLVWTRPQFDAARAIKVVRSSLKKESNGLAKSGHGNGAPTENGLRHRKGDQAVASPVQDECNPGESHAWIWQPFPADAPLSKRLNWAFDLTTSFRCIGWNWSITSAPLPEIPDVIRLGDPVVLRNMPKVSKSGYVRSLTESEFVWSRIRSVALMYILLDFLSVFMMKDPFFIYGPDYEGYQELPSYLQGLPSWLLLSYRELFSLGGIYAAIESVFDLHDLAQFYLVSYIFPIRGELWQYTTVFGGFSEILDRGLAGFWGSWWHQTFRLQFIAPSTYLIQHGYLPKRGDLVKIVALYVSFIQSGILHASGSASSMPYTKIWRAPLFFFLQATGIVVQMALTRALKRSYPQIPRGLFQAYNFIFSLIWLQVTARPFVHDLASTGLWVLEPVPISPLRWMGCGHPTDHWWRWTREQFPSWYSSGRWWETGIAL